MVMDCTTGLHSDHDVYAAQCPCRAMLDLLANKWSALAIGALEEGPQRFGELQRRLQGVSPKVLTQTLRRLQDFDLLTRTVYPAVPLHVEYALTPLGQSAAVPLRSLRTWVEENLDNTATSCQPVDA
jgi:DNA-binding HxlR family transcriptional regulator